MTQGKYLKRYAVPRSWTLHKKEKKFVTKPSPGPHAVDDALPLGLVMKKIGVANTTNEARQILNTKHVLVDGKKAVDHRRPIGLFDVITFKEINKSYTVGLDSHGRIVITEAAEPKSKPCRINGKTLLKGGKAQLNLSGSRNIITDGKSYKVGDTILVELPSQKIAGHIKLDKNSKVLLIAGRHLGKTAKVSAVEGNKVKIIVGDIESETTKDNTFVIP